jgi:hypothetical protein
MIDGIDINIIDNELVIKGDKDNLLELANYINEVANSSLEKDHLHLDNQTIIDKNSTINELIIEKI